MTTGRMAEAAAPGTFPFRLERRGVVMAPLPGEPTEAWGVLNPATARRGDDTYSSRESSPRATSRASVVAASSLTRAARPLESSARGRPSNRRRPGNCTPAAAAPRTQQQTVRYSAGAMILDSLDVTRVLARSAHPLLEPELLEEVEGTVGNVVFPTAIEPARGGGAFDVYYGMADCRIGVARLTRIQPDPAGS